MRTKISLCIIISILLCITLASGNVLKYSDGNKKVEITDSLSNPVANITLKTPLVNYVMRGKDRLVAEFEINNLNEKDGVFNKMDFYDMDLGMWKINRNFEYKYKESYEVTIKDYQVNCKTRKSVNGSDESYDCVNNYVGDHSEIRYRWIKLDTTSRLNKGVHTIGIFTDVKKGDNIEWIPTLYNVRVNEWANWLESMDLGLVGYWDLNENTGTVAEGHDGLHNLTISDGTWTSGILGSAINITTGYMENTQTLEVPTNSNYSVSFWVADNSTSGDQGYFIGDKDSDDNRMIRQDSNGFGYYVGGTNFYVAKAPYSYQWVHIVLITNESGHFMYVNGTYGSGSAGTNFEEFKTVNVEFGDPSRIDEMKTFDEIGIWNRSLTDTEITNLYNNGKGVVYGDYPGVDLISPIDNYMYYLTETVNFNVSYDDDTLSNISFILNDVNMNTTDTENGLNEIIFTNNFPSGGGYNWTVYLSYDNGSNAYFSENRSLKSTSQYTISLGLTPTCNVENGTISDTYLYSSGNNPGERINCTLDGYNDYVETYNISDGDKIITMTKNSIKLWFNYFNGTMYKSSGYWNNLTNGSQFFTTNLSLDPVSLGYSRVSVFFGYNTSVQNYSQFYEFDNNQGDEIENLTIIEKGDITTWFEVVDDEGKPIEDALIRVFTIPLGENTSRQLMGQRYTEADGKTFFYFDEFDHVSWMITKEGYNIDTEGDNSQDLQATSRDTAMKRVLSRSGNTVKDGVWIGFRNWFTNRSLDINISIYAPERTNASFSTDGGVNKYPITLDRNYVGIDRLLSGTHFSDSGTDDISLNIYVDGTLHGTFTINYRTVEVGIIEEIDGIDSTTRDRLLWIGLILIAGVLGVYMRTEKGGVGKTAFLAGALLLGLIYYESFKWLFYGSMAYFALIMIRRYISE